MKSVLFCIPLKPGTLQAYLDFADALVKRADEYKAMLKRYDILCTKVWNTTLAGKEYVFSYHDVGDQFEEKMSQLAASIDPFDTWFNEHFLSFYDMDAAGTVEEPDLVLNIKA